MSEREWALVMAYMCGDTKPLLDYIYEGKTFLVDHESGQKVEVVEGRAQIRECVLIVDEGYVFLRRMKNG